MSFENLKFGKFLENYQKWLESQMQVSEGSEPQFAKCGELLLVERSQMQEEVTYCDNTYHYSLTRRPRRDGSGTIYTPNESVLTSTGYCASYRKSQGWKDPYENMTFKNFDRANDPSNAYEVVFNFQIPGKLLIGGPRGRGKTHLARAKYRVLLSQQKVCIWLKAPDLAESWRKYAGSYDYDTQTENMKFKDALRNADCIFIDDLAEERLPLGADGKPRSDLFNEQFKMLIEDCKALIITTNSDGKMLKERYGDKIFDRLMEGATTAKTEGENYRSRSFPQMQRKDKRA